MKKSISTLKKIGVSLLAMTALLGSSYTQAFAATASTSARLMVNTNYSTQVNQNTSYRLTVDGVDKTSAVNFVAQGDRSMIGLRDFAGVLGCTVDWDNEKVAIVTKGSTTLEVPIGSPNILVNGQQKAIDQQGTISIIVNSRTYLPFRVIAESLGYTVSYDNETKTIQVTSGSSTQPQPTPQPNPSGNQDYEKPTAETIKSRMGYDLNHLPPDNLRECFDRYVAGYQAMGLTTDQINSNLREISLAPNGTGENGKCTNEQMSHWNAWCDAFAHTPRPTEAGTFRGQVKDGHVWNGDQWNFDDRLPSGMQGLHLQSY